MNRSFPAVAAGLLTPVAALLLSPAPEVPSAPPLAAPPLAAAPRAAPQTWVRRVHAADAARAFLATLDDAGLAKARFALDDAERTNWHFVPGRYPGIELGALGLPARRAAHDLLQAVFSPAGYLETTSVMGLERVLHDLAAAAGERADHRDPERYALAIFGEPAPTGRWALRLQGHHLSWNLTFVGDRAHATPRFVGANPHEVREGQFTGLRVLGRHEDLARALLLSFGEAQRTQATLEGEVPADVLLVPGRPLDTLGAPQGLPARDMTPGQQAQLRQLIGVVLGTLQPEFAAQEWARIDAAGFGAIHFSWMGRAERGQKHYWRIHAPGFAIEYDNIQNGANHSHVVWHDLSGGSFGGDDLLKQHVERDHR